MATSKLRIRFEAWANNIFLTGAVTTFSSDELAAGLVVFMAQRKLMAHQLGSDYLLALPYLSREDTSDLLLSFKHNYVQMHRTEKSLRAMHGKQFYERVFSGTTPSPLSYRIAASVAVQLISPHIAPQAQRCAAKSIHGIVKSALPSLAIAHEAARHAKGCYHDEFCSVLGIPPDNLSDSINSITAKELSKPLAPAPAWLVAHLASLRH